LYWQYGASWVKEREDGPAWKKIDREMPIANFHRFCLPFGSQPVLLPARNQPGAVKG
jgi:hypothetical protein